MLVFFALNGIELRYTQKELYEMVLAVADSSLDYEDMLKWVLEPAAVREGIKSRIAEMRKIYDSE